MYVYSIRYTAFYVDKDRLGTAKQRVLKKLMSLSDIFIGKLAEALKMRNLLLNIELTKGIFKINNKNILLILKALKVGYR